MRLQRIIVASRLRSLNSPRVMRSLLLGLFSISLHGSVPLRAGCDGIVTHEYLRDSLRVDWCDCRYTGHWADSSSSLLRNSHRGSDGRCDSNHGLVLAGSAFDSGDGEALWNIPRGMRHTLSWTRLCNCVGFLLHAR